MELISQKMRELAPELDPLRIGTGWKPEDLSKPQIMIESTFGDSHPGSGHLDILVEEVRKGVDAAGGHGARYFATDICDGESQGTDGINFSLASREMIANMIEIHGNATPFDGGVFLASCDKGMPANLMGLANIIGIAGERKTPEEIDAVLLERRKNWQPRAPKYQKGVLRLFSELAASPMKGAYLEYDK